MKKSSLLLFLLVLTFGIGSAYADCHTVTGPYYAGVWGWYNYQIPADCYETVGTVTDEAPSCSYDPTWRFGQGWTNQKKYEFTVGSEILNPSGWQLSSVIDFDDPDNSWWNQIELTAYVYHPDGSTSTYNVFSWNGTMGDLQCSSQWGLFTANTGDRVAIVVRSTGFGTAVIKASLPSVMNVFP